jgi:hypothetical protein
MEFKRPFTQLCLLNLCIDSTSRAVRLFIFQQAIVLAKEPSIITQLHQLHLMRRIGVCHKKLTSTFKTGSGWSCMAITKKRRQR